MRLLTLLMHYYAAALVDRLTKASFLVKLLLLTQFTVQLAFVFQKRAEGIARHKI